MARVAAVRAANTPEAVGAGGAAGWSARLYDGLRARRLAPETGRELMGALGEVGVEAEYLLVLVSALPGDAQPTHATGAQFLQRLEASLLRLVAASAALEVATQGYLTTLEAAYPELRAHRRDEVWWGAFRGYTLRGESVEARLRRCGYAYRQVVESRLPLSLEATLEQMALTLYALSALPPAGTAPITTLAAGLYELSSALHGDLIPRHITGASGDARYPGALASIARLRQLDAGGDTSLEGDIAWARAQYAAIRESRASFGPALASAPPTAALVAAQGGDARMLAAQAAYEWGQTIGFLESLRQPASR